MTDHEADAVLPITALADPVHAAPPRAYGPAAPISPGRTSWGALALAFFLGGFTCFVAISLLALVLVVWITSVGENANSTFQKVSNNVGGPSASPTFQHVGFDPPADNAFQRGNEAIKGTGDETPDPKDDRRDKNK